MKPINLFLFISILFIWFYKETFANEMELSSHFKSDDFDHVFKKPIDPAKLFINKKGFPFNNCTLDEKNTIILDPIPSLKQMTKQGEFGICYAAAALFALEEGIARFSSSSHQSIEQATSRHKYSLPHSLCQFSTNHKAKEELAINGGNPEIFLLNLMAENNLILESEESCSMEHLTNQFRSLNQKYCGSQNNLNLDDIPLEQLTKIKSELHTFISEKNKILQNGPKYTLPPFTIHTYLDQTKKDQDIFTIIKDILSLNRMATISTKTHVSNIFGALNYNCFDKKGEALKIQTYLIIDPNGFKVEILADQKNMEIDSLLSLEIFKDQRERKNLVEGASNTTEIAYHLSNESLEKLIKIPAFPIDEPYVDSSNKKLNLLLYAINRKDINKMELLLKAGADPVYQFADGLTPLHNAISSSDKATILKLLQFIKGGESINKKSGQGDTPLCQAILSEREIIIEILEKGGDPNIPCSKGKTPLELVLENSFQNNFYKNALLTLLQKGAIFNNPNSSATIGILIKYFDPSTYPQFFKAGVSGDEMLIQLFKSIAYFNLDIKENKEKFLELIKLGKNPFQTSPELNWPLLHGFFNYDFGKGRILGDDFIEQILRNLDPTIDLKSEINRINPGDQKTLLCIAIEEKSERSVKLFLENGADPKIRCTIFKFSPLCEALRNEPINVPIVKLLLNNLKGEPILNEECGKFLRQTAINVVKNLEDSKIKSELLEAFKDIAMVPAPPPPKIAPPQAGLLFMKAKK